MLKKLVYFRFKHGSKKKFPTKKPIKWRRREGGNLLTQVQVIGEC